MEDSDALVLKLLELQKIISYGLHDLISVMICELGFFDRVISSELMRIIGDVGFERSQVVRALKDNNDDVLQLLAEYPIYFTQVYQSL